MPIRKIGAAKICPSEINFANREAVDEYVRQREVEADMIERQIRAEFHSDALRERLLARRAQKP